MKHASFLALSTALVCACGGATDNPFLDSGNPTDSSMSGDSSVQDGANDTMKPDADANIPDVPIDTGPEKSSLYCGQALMCSVPKEQCCRTGDFNYQYQCQASGSQCNGLTIPCDKAKNCESLGMPNTVCCAHYVPNGQTTTVDMVSCKPVGQCTNMNASIILCDPNNVNSCPIGTCTQSMITIPGYWFCK